MSERQQADDSSETYKTSVVSGQWERQESADQNAKEMLNATTDDDSRRRSTTPTRPPPRDSNPNGTNAVPFDKKTPKYEIIAVREHHGLFRKAVPCMPLSLAIVLCLFNVVTPGVGTLISGMTVLCGCKTEHKSRTKSIVCNVVAAVVQLTTAPIVIGWVWSIMWGVTFVNVSVSGGMEESIVATHV